MNGVRKDEKKQKSPPKQPQVFRKPHVDTRFTEASKNAKAMPVDFSYHKYKETKPTEADAANLERLGAGVTTLSKNNKYLTRSFWLNHNMIRSIKNIDAMIESVLEYPERLGFLDLSHNQVSVIDEALLKFKNLRVLYLHDNKIAGIDEVFKLRELKKLHNLTMFGNPLYDLDIHNFRTTIKRILPQVRKLDYNLFTAVEINSTPSGYILRRLEEVEGTTPPYIPCKKINPRKQLNVAINTNEKRKTWVKDIEMNSNIPKKGNMQELRYNEKRKLGLKKGKADITDDFKLDRPKQGRLELTKVLKFECLCSPIKYN